MKLLIVVPTRNRADLAAKTVESVLEDPHPDVMLVVSDNSSTPAQRRGLAETVAARCDIIYPPSEMDMATHWEWALWSAVEHTRATHVTYLSDRFVLKYAVIADLLSHVRACPDDVFVYNHDCVLDERRPVRVALQSGSWDRHTVSTVALLDRVAGGEPWQWAIPRMLNCIVPVDVLRSIRKERGRVFASLAPDFYFGFHAAATLATFQVWDFSPIAHHGLARSNGHAHMTGRANSESVDFNARSCALVLESPFPALRTLSNVIFHEYNVVARETESAKFQHPSDATVKAAVAADALGMTDLAARRAVFEALGMPVPRRRPLTPRAIAARAWRLTTRHVCADRLPFSAQKRIGWFRLTFRDPDRALTFIRMSAAGPAETGLPGVAKADIRP